MIGRNKVKLSQIHSRGSALLYIILAVAVLSFVGLSLLLTTYGNQNQTKAFRDYEAAYYKSEGTLQIGTQAIMKAGAIKMAELEASGSNEFETAFLEDIVRTASELLAPGLVIPQEGEEGLYIEIIDSEPAIIRLTSTGMVNGRVRTTRRDLTLQLGTGGGSGGGFQVFDNYSTFIGGDIRFPVQNPATTQIVFQPRGVIDGIIDSGSASVTNYTDIFPPEFTFLDSVTESLGNVLSEQAAGTLIQDGDILKIRAGTSLFPQDTVRIRMSGQSVQIGSRLFPDLRGKTLLVLGNVVMETDLRYTSGRFDELMIFATGDITLSAAGSTNNQINDALYLFSGNAIRFTDRRQGGTHNLSLRAENVYYSAMEPGSTRTTFMGQWLVKDTIYISTRSGRFDMNFIYDQSQTRFWYDQLNLLSREGFIGEGDVADQPDEVKNIFIGGRITEIPEP